MRCGHSRAIAALQLSLKPNISGAGLAGSGATTGWQPAGYLLAWHAISTRPARACHLGRDECHPPVPAWASAQTTHLAPAYRTLAGHLGLSGFPDKEGSWRYWRMRGRPGLQAQATTHHAITLWSTTCGLCWEVRCPNPGSLYVPRPGDTRRVPPRQAWKPRAGNG